MTPMLGILRTHADTVSGYLIGVRQLGRGTLSQNSHTPTLLFALCNFLENWAWRPTPLALHLETYVNNGQCTSFFRPPLY